jgi:hypothetical protein
VKYPLRDFNGEMRSRLRQQHHEFVAAITRQYIGMAQPGFNAFRHQFQYAYREMFRAEIDSTALAEIRATANRGWPLGGERFKDAVEQALACSVRPPKRTEPSAVVARMKSGAGVEKIDDGASSWIAPNGSPLGGRPAACIRATGLD